jgi:hypothetical protein
VSSVEANKLDANRPRVGDRCWPPTDVEYAAGVRSVLALIRSLYLVARAAVAMLCVVLACGRARAAENMPPSVGVDFSTLDAKTYQDIDGLALEKATLLRLVQEGFPVVAVSASPVVLISLRHVPAGLVIEARGRSTVRSILSLPEGSLAEFHLTVVQRIVALARVSLRPAPGGEPQPLPRAAPQRQAEATPRRIRSERSESRRGEIEMNAGAGALWRGDTRDLFVRAAVRYAVTTRVGVIGGLGFTPSTGPGIGVLEWQPEIGLDYRLLDLRRVHLDVGVAIGLVLQHYRLEDSAAEDREHVLVDAVARVPFMLSYSGRHLGIGVWGAPGVASREHRHTANGAVLWDRGAVRVEAGVALLWRW